MCGARACLIINCQTGKVVEGEAKPDVGDEYQVFRTLPFLQQNEERVRLQDGDIIAVLGKTQMSNIETCFFTHRNFVKI